MANASPVARYVVPASAFSFARSSVASVSSGSGGFSGDFFGGAAVAGGRSLLSDSRFSTLASRIPDTAADVCGCAQMSADDGAGYFESLARVRWYFDHVVTWR
jgi:hypothetical protein